MAPTTYMFLFYSGAIKPGPISFGLSSYLIGILIFFISSGQFGTAAKRAPVATEAGGASLMEAGFMAAPQGLGWCICHFNV